MVVVQIFESHQAEHVSPLEMVAAHKVCIVASRYLHQREAQHVQANAWHTYRRRSHPLVQSIGWPALIRYC
jgi:hypothetical protein